MRSTTDPSLATRWREALRRRGPPLLLALAAEALLVLLFLALAPRFAPELVPTSSLTTFDVADGTEDAPTAVESEDSDEASAGEVASVQPPEPVVPRDEPPPTPPAPPPEVKLPSNVIWLTREQYTSSALPKGEKRVAEAPAGTPSLTAGGGGGARPGDSALAEGSGPNGEPLYAAEWHTRPTNAQLSTYMPERQQEGWGLIACRTAPGYRVEDCRELADSPRGSRLAGAVRQAAWQFRVRPPRVGGREMVGAWVSIRIDYTVRGARGG
ncbi:hypothetical protein OKW76_11390 [Sphingomonas sp. S1-29]|uniref:hypothetical protein n=1 Tax=Sphingomonas sp. S1-29 TaxID=2991074 RepID=UPI00223FBA39|nr:hypothetical protein [Sphingomonas sp. S1-29]UZK68648.1 hypothetical protein OKW76_11390 [Sphingomonas sp. S1-29]